VKWGNNDQAPSTEVVPAEKIEWCPTKDTTTQPHQRPTRGPRYNHKKKKKRLHLEAKIQPPEEEVEEETPLNSQLARTAVQPPEEEEKTPLNSQLARRKAAICLGPSGNTQGGFTSMSLASGKRIGRYSWDAIPVLQINQIERDRPSQLLLTNRKGSHINDIELTGVNYRDGTFNQQFGESTRIRVQTKQPYVTSMKGNNHAYAIAQMDERADGIH
jgi:hypothetical protein